MINFHVRKDVRFFKISSDYYTCSVCGKQHVKLWVNTTNDKLFCSNCVIELVQKPQKIISQPKLNGDFCIYSLIGDPFNAEICYSETAVIDHFMPAIPKNINSIWSFNEAPDFAIKHWRNLKTN